MQAISKFCAERATAEKAIGYDSMYYTAKDIALIIRPYQFSVKMLSLVLKSIWEGEQRFLSPELKGRKKDFFLAVYYQLDYWEHEQEIQSEAKGIQQDAEDLGLGLTQDDLLDDGITLDLFFKALRLRLLYLSPRFYARIKYKTLLSKYGYKRRTQRFITYVKERLDFYGIQAYSSGGVVKELKDIPVDSYITFRMK